MFDFYDDLIYIIFQNQVLTDYLFDECGIFLGDFLVENQFNQIFNNIDSSTINNAIQGQIAQNEVVGNMNIQNLVTEFIFKSIENKKIYNLLNENYILKRFFDKTDIYNSKGVFKNYFNNNQFESKSFFDSLSYNYKENAFNQFFKNISMDYFQNFLNENYIGDFIRVYENKDIFDILKINNRNINKTGIINEVIKKNIDKVIIEDSFIKNLGSTINIGEEGLILNKSVLNNSLLENILLQPLELKILELGALELKAELLKPLLIKSLLLEETELQQDKIYNSGLFKNLSFNHQIINRNFSENIGNDFQNNYFFDVIKNIQNYKTLFGLDYQNDILNIQDIDRLNYNNREVIGYDLKNYFYSMAQNYGLENVFYNQANYINNQGINYNSYIQNMDTAKASQYRLFVEKTSFNESVLDNPKSNVNININQQKSEIKIDDIIDKISHIINEGNQTAILGVY